MYVFISDLHLDPTRPGLTRAFQTFLEQDARTAERLFILGDLFEAWIGDDDNAPLAETVRTALKSLTDAGVQVAVQHGNRDFMLGERFAAETGCELLPEIYPLDLFGTPSLLMHGDSLCTRDTAYMEWRATCRAPQWQAGMLAIPLEERRQLVAGLRDQSMEANSNKAEDIMDVTPEEVTAVLREHGASLLIHGHTHRPDVHDLQVDGKPARRLVLGDWDDCLWFARAEPGRLELTRRLLAD